MKNSSSSSSTQRKCAFARKCARLVKEQRARFYIMRHCVIMLICWHESFLLGMRFFLESTSVHRKFSSSSSIMKNSSSSSSTQRKCAFARKCARLVKEQRARFYIMRHCVIMLICWHEYNDS
ncbi:hypothetical protein JHK85_045481 [Glycine max]|nr:hypothetical protein JHK86_044865 [Glycine max]KAG4951614.1 hypothetical protein JHK85_045481 [Glycine max]